MHLAFRERGYSGQEVLWDFFDGGILQLHTSNENERLRMRVLMKQYSDTPMDLADASLVVAAETLGTKVIFTLDSDFHVYRLTNGEGFEVLP